MRSQMSKTVAVREKEAGWRGLGAVVAGILERVEIVREEPRLVPVRVTADTHRGQAAGRSMPGNR